MTERTNRTGMAIASLHGVEKTYGTGAAMVRALRGVDLDIRGGELMVLLGPSGSGKTTLLNIVGGIEPATSGRVTVGGADIASLDDAARTEYRRTSVGFVFQFFNLIPTLTALENVQLIAELVGGGEPGRSELVLRAVGLSDRMHHFPGALSGGEQQRVAIARALVKEPPLLLCDEPTGSLDLETGRRVLALLRSLASNDGRTIVIVTHNSAIAAIADRVVTMGSGQVTDLAANPAPAAAETLEW